MGDPASLSLQLSRLTGKVTSLEDALTRLTTEKNSALEEVQKLVVAMHQAEDELQGQQVAWKNTAEEFRQEHSRLKTELQLLASENKELQKCIGKHKDHNRALLESRSVQIKSLKSEKYAKNHELADRNRDCLSLQSQLASQSILVDTLEKELTNLKESVWDVKSSVLSQDKRFNEHKDKVQEGMVSQGALQKKINEQQATIEEMKLQLEGSKGREEKYIKRIEHLEMDLREAKDQLSSLSAEWTESEMRQVHDAQEKKKLEDAIHRGESVIQTLRGSLQEQSCKMEELRKMVQDVAMATPSLQTPAVQRGQCSAMNTPKYRGGSEHRGPARLSSNDRTPIGQRRHGMGYEDLTPSHFTTPHTSYPTDMKTPGAPIRTRGTSLVAQASEARAQLNTNSIRKYSGVGWRLTNTDDGDPDKVGTGSRGLLMNSGSGLFNAQQKSMASLLEIYQDSNNRQEELGCDVSSDGNQEGPLGGLRKADSPQDQLEKQPVLAGEVGGEEQEQGDGPTDTFLEQGMGEKSLQGSQDDVMTIDVEQGEDKQEAIDCEGFVDPKQVLDSEGQIVLQGKQPKQKVPQAHGSFSNDYMEVEAQKDEKRTGGHGMDARGCEVQMESAEKECLKNAIESNSCGVASTSGDCNKDNHSSADQLSQQSRQAQDSKCSEAGEVCAGPHIFSTSRPSNESERSLNHVGELGKVAMEQPQRLDGVYGFEFEKLGQKGSPISADKLDQHQQPLAVGVSRKRGRDESGVVVDESKMFKLSSEAGHAPASKPETLQNANDASKDESARKEADGASLQTETRQNKQQKSNRVGGVGGLFTSLAE